MSKRDVTLFAKGLKFPEGPAFDRKGNLFVVNVQTADVSKISPDGVVETFVNTGGHPNGAKFHANGDLYVADRERGILSISPKGDIRIIVDNFQGKKFNGPNDLMFDSKGNLYFTDPHGSSPANPIGCIYKFSAAGEITLIASGLPYPNGLVVCPLPPGMPSPSGSLMSPEGIDLFVAITHKNRIIRFTLDERGIPVRSTIFSQLSGGWAGPDGMAMDTAGHLYVAHYSAGDVLILNRRGEIIERVPVVGSRPTNVAFGGPDRKTLFVTETETGAIYKFNTDHEGILLYG